MCFHNPPSSGGSKVRKSDAKPQFKVQKLTNSLDSVDLLSAVFCAVDFLCASSFGRKSTIRIKESKKS